MSESQTNNYMWQASFLSLHTNPWLRYASTYKTKTLCSSEKHCLCAHTRTNHSIAVCSVCSTSITLIHCSAVYMLHTAPALLSVMLSTNMLSTILFFVVAQTLKHTQCGQTINNNNQQLQQQRQFEYISIGVCVQFKT